MHRVVQRRLELLRGRVDVGTRRQQELHQHERLVPIEHRLVQRRLAELVALRDVGAAIEQLTRQRHDGRRRAALGKIVQRRVAVGVARVDVDARKRDEAQQHVVVVAARRPVQRRVAECVGRVDHVARNHAGLQQQVEHLGRVGLDGGVERRVAVEIELVKRHGAGRQQLAQPSGVVVRHHCVHVKTGAGRGGGVARRQLRRV